MLRFLQTNGEFCLIQATDIRAVVGAPAAMFDGKPKAPYTRIDYEFGAVFVNETVDEVEAMLSESVNK